MLPGMKPCTPHRHSSTLIRKDEGPLAASERSDCTVRALAAATGFSYSDCHAFMELFGRKRGQGFNPRFRGVVPEGFGAKTVVVHDLLPFKATLVYDILTEGLHEREVRHHGPNASYGYSYSTTHTRRLTLRAFARAHPVGKFYLHVAGHATAIVDGVLVDYSDRDLRKVEAAWQIETIPQGA